MSASNRSIPELLTDAFGQLAKLVSNEIELAKAEASAKVAQIGRGVALIFAGSMIFTPALVLLLMAVAALLSSSGLSPAASYALTGLGALAIAGGLIGYGVTRLKPEALKPKETIGQLEQDKRAAQEMVR